jgi:hypothetical protein
MVKEGVDGSSPSEGFLKSLQIGACSFDADLRRQLPPASGDRFWGQVLGHWHPPTGHEIGGTIGIAIFSMIAAGISVLAGPQAASGIAHAFVAAGVIAGVASRCACRLAEVTSLPAEAAAEPQRDARPLNGTANGERSTGHHG